MQAYKYYESTNIAHVSHSVAQYTTAAIASFLFKSSLYMWIKNTKKHENSATQNRFSRLAIRTHKFYAYCVLAFRMYSSLYRYDSQQLQWTDGQTHHTHTRAHTRILQFVHLLSSETDNDLFTVIEVCVQFTTICQISCLIITSSVFLSSAILTVAQFFLYINAVFGAKSAYQDQIVYFFCFNVHKR